MQQDLAEEWTQCINSWNLSFKEISVEKQDFNQEFCACILRQQILFCLEMNFKGFFKNNNNNTIVSHSKSSTKILQLFFIFPVHISSVLWVVIVVPWESTLKQ